MNFSDAQPIFQFSAAGVEQTWVSLHRSYPAIATDGNGRYFYSGGEKETLGDAVHAEMELIVAKTMLWSGFLVPPSEEEVEAIHQLVFKQAREEYERQFPG